MKTLKQVPIELVILSDDEFMPDIIPEGKLYYSKEYGISVHMCLCGCGVKCPIPIGEGEWTLTIHDNNKPTLTPSLLQRFECKSHYIITNGIANFV